MTDLIHMIYMPYFMTVLAEWGACVISVLYIKKRFDQKITVLLCIAGLPMNYLMMKVAFKVENVMNVFWYIRMIPLLIYMFLFLYLLLDISWKNTVFLWCKTFLTAELMASGTWGIYCRIIYSTGHESIWIRTLLIVLIYGAVLSATFFMEHSDAEYFNQKDIDDKQNLISVLLGIIMFYLSNRNMSEVAGLSAAEGMQIYDMRAVFDMMGYVILYLLQKIFIEHDMASEITAVKNMLNLQYAQYVNFKEASEFIGRQCHDLKHQINILREQSEETEREQYLEQIEETIQNYDSSISTGNNVLDTILTQKNMYCRKHGIELNCQADGRGLDYLAVRDICSIFGNILDNAIEAVIKYENPEKRVVHGEVYNKNSFIVIRFENYFEDDLILKDHLPVTTKSDKARHGYGTKSIKYTAEKYGGNVFFKKEKNWFVVTVMIPKESN